VHWTSTDSQATLPGDYAFTSGDQGVGTFAGSGFVLKTAPSQTITVADGSVSRTSNSITVNTSGFDHFGMVSYPSSVTAGLSFGSDVVIIAYDANGNVKIDYTGQVWFTSTDGQAVLPYTPESKYMFTSGDHGIHTFLGTGFVLKTAPSQTITVTDGAKLATSSSIAVKPGVLGSFTMTGYPSSVTAGQSFDGSNVVVTAYDAYNNVKVDYTGKVYFTSTDGQAVLPYTSVTKYTFTIGAGGDNGVHTFLGSGFVLKTAGGQTVTVTDGSKSVTSSSIVVNTGLASIVYSVVRGADSRVYYSSSLAGTWTVLPGSTPDSPAAAVCGVSLHVAVRGSDNGIYYGYVTLSDYIFHGWTRVSGSTPSAPGLAADSSCKLYLVVRGATNGIYLNVLPVGGSWSGWSTLPGATIDSPAVAVAGTVLHIAVRGSDGSSIYDGRKDLTGGSWLGWTRVSGSSPSRPALAAVSATEVYMAVRGSDNRVYINQWNGVAWAGWSVIPTGSTLNGPSIAIANGQLYVAVQGGGNGIYWCSRSLPLSSGAWSAWTKRSGGTPSSPALAA